MKHTRITWILLLLACLTTPLQANRRKVEAARQSIMRVVGDQNLPLSLTLKPNAKGDKSPFYYQYEVERGELKITGNTPVALCRGFYDYAKRNHFGLHSWSGTNITLPQTLPDFPMTKAVSPFGDYYMSNVVVYGYSKPYWTWARWEQEIDWMATHGITMPLALVAYEAIIARVWKRMGLTDEEINQFFVGPAHLPWMRMGNMSNAGETLNDEWHEGQIALQHRILERMRGLDMKPICLGFAGFVPKAFTRLYPDLELIETQWAGAFNNWMISPQHELFVQIGTAFIKEWEREFGRCDYYLIDSFNEMEVPFPPKGTPERYELLAAYGDKVYESIKKGNKNATWVMQGWMFGYQRYIWDQETLAALVSKVPDEKMILLDLAVDYNKHFWHSEVNWEYHKGFYNKPWVYSVIPNMGGKTGFTGHLEFYANGHLEALNSAHKGKLIAHGMAPEGIENNEVIYELLADAGWSDSIIDLSTWLRDYSINRYGDYPAEVAYYWQNLLASVYGSFTDHPRYNWQFRPGRVKQGSINLSQPFFTAIESLVKAAPQFVENRLFEADLVESVALYLGGKAELLLGGIDKAYEAGDTLRAIKLEGDFEYLLKGIDELLAAHPTLRLDLWCDYAEQHSTDPAQQQAYVNNAKRLVTIWGPPIDDYSARVWSGLVADYYLPRWQHYFASRKSGTPFDYAAWEKAWVAEYRPHRPTPPTHLRHRAQELVDYAAFITPAWRAGNQPNLLGNWQTMGSETVTFTLTGRQISELMGFVLTLEEGEAEVTSIKLVADGTTYLITHAPFHLTGEDAKKSIPWIVPQGLTANNGAELQLSFGKNPTASKGNIGLLTNP